MSPNSKLTLVLCSTVLLAVFLCAPGSLQGQTRALGALGGRVQDAQGGSLAGAEVRLKDPSTGYDRSVITDVQGNYIFLGVPLTGRYTLSVAAAKFSPSERTGLELRAGETAEVDFTLNVSGQAAQVTVYGTAATVDAEFNQVSNRLDLRKIENTPIVGNKLTSLALLDSSVRPSRTTGDLFTDETLFVINGGGRRQTTYSIDNADGNDSWGRQTIFTALPYASVQEFTILTAATSAEYGFTSGSAINVVTKSGTNLFHGDFVGMGRPGFSEASTPLVSPLARHKAEDTFAQGSGAFSGPVLTDSTYFLVSGEFNRGFRDAVITSPLDPGAIFTGNYKQELFLVRLDHRLTSRNTVMFRANLDHFRDTNPQDTVSGNTFPSAARAFEKGTYSFLLSDTAVLGTDMVNEVHVQVQAGTPITRFTPVNPGPQFLASGFYTYGTSLMADLANHQVEEGDTFSMSRGKHFLKSGFDLVQSSSGGYGQEFGGGFTDGQFQINPCYATIPLATLLTLNPGAPPGIPIPPGAPACVGTPPLASSFSQAFGNQKYNIKELLWAAFVQDDWHVKPDLTLNLGLRYEGQTFVGDDNNVSPRIGLAWLLPHTSATVVRAGYGIYYSEIRADLAAGYELGNPLGIFAFSAAPGACGFPSAFTPWASLSALLDSAACTGAGGTLVPLRDITVQLGDAQFLNKFFDVSDLRFYPHGLVNPYTQQWNLGVQHELAKGWIFSVDYIGSHSVKLERPDDLNAPAPLVRTGQGQTRSVAAANASRPVQSATPCTITSPTYSPAFGNCFNNYREIMAIVNLGSGTYNGLQIKLQKQFSHHFSLLASYTYSHAIDTVEPDAANQNANDWNFLDAAERATSLLDQRHRAALSGWYDLPWGLTVGTNATLAAGLPFNVTTGTDNNGDGVTADRPVINGAVIPRNYGRGTPTYDWGVSLQKQIPISDRVRLMFRAEAFNVLNHSNFYGRSGTYGNAATPPASFGTPVGGLANVGPPRQMQFMARIQF